MKRKQPDSDDGERRASAPKRQRTTAVINSSTNENADANRSPDMTPSKRIKSTPQKPSSPTPAALKESGLKTPTHRSKAKALFSTPTKATAFSTPNRARNADRSAKKKSARLLLEQDEDEIWDGADRLAEEILEDEGDAPETAIEDSDGVIATVEGTTKEAADGKTAATPKRRAGRPKGAKNKRSPTPEGELPAHERYFFQNRAGPPRTSNNTLNKMNLLTHEEYFEKLAGYTDPCQKEIGRAHV